jgi:hypothetical protein
MVTEIVYSVENEARNMKFDEIVCCVRVYEINLVKVNKQILQ